MSMEIEVVSNLDLAGRPAQVINGTTIGTGEIARAPQVQSLVREISRWVDEARGRGAHANMFRRDRFVPPDHPYALMRAAKDATDSDDIVSGVLEATTAIGFPGVKWEGDNPDEVDCFNQMNADLDLDGFIRAAYRDTFRYDQFVAAKVWGWSEYTVRGTTTKGNKRKKTYRLWCPQRLVILDSEKVVPVGRGPLRTDGLAWAATGSDLSAYQNAFDGTTIDPLMTMFFDGTYIPSQDESRQMVDWGVDPTGLLKMNPDWVFRHTTAKADHELFPQLKMKAVFALLDLKQQLMASDRATLIGSANYILLIRQGTDEKPGTPEEIANLKQNYNMLAKLPVIIADHRLSVDIIAPKMDFVLNGAHYDTIDKRILARLLGALAIQQNRESGGTNQIGALVARVTENRRHMIKRTLEREIGRAIVNHPKNAGVFDSGPPSLVYTPRNVSVDTDQAYLSALLALRTQKEISRETTLEYLGLDQAAEAQRRELEDEIYDEIFQTQVPFAAQGVTGGGAADPNAGDQNSDPNAADNSNNGSNSPTTAPQVTGKRGGRPRGGGQTPQSPQAQSKPKTANGNPSTRSS